MTFKDCAIVVMNAAGFIALILWLMCACICWDEYSREVKALKRHVQNCPYMQHTER